MSLTKAVARGVGYPLLALLGVLLFPLTVGIAVATNYRGTAERVAGVPGVDADGSLISGTLLGLIAFAIVASAVAGAVVVTSDDVPGGDVLGGETTPTEAPATPTETPTATPEATPYQTVEPNVDYTTFRFCNKFETVTRDATDLNVDGVTTDGTNCNLILIQDPPLTEEEISDNVSTVSGGYLSAVNHTKNGHPDELNVLVTDHSDNTLYTYYIKTEWASKELEGEISTTEYLNKTHDTIEIGGKDSS